MQYLVAYDVRDDRRRYAVASILLDYGPRVQESVFWMEVDEELAERMVGRLRKALAEEDILWVVPVCRNCTKAVMLMGATRIPEMPEFWVI